MAIAAGELDRRITLEASTTTQATNGQRIPAWTAYATVWAKVTPLQGRELERAKMFFESADIRIKIRFRDDVTAKHRIRYLDRIFYINSVIDTDEAAVELIITATEEKPRNANA